MSNVFVGHSVNWPDRNIKATFVLTSRQREKERKNPPQSRRKLNYQLLPECSRKFQTMQHKLPTTAAASAVYSVQPSRCRVRSSRFTSFRPPVSSCKSPASEEVVRRPQFTIVNQCNILTWSAGNGRAAQRKEKISLAKDKVAAVCSRCEKNSKAKSESSYRIQQLNRFSSI